MLNNKRVNEYREISVKDFEKGQKLIWGRERSLAKIPLRQIDRVVNELLPKFPEIENYNPYRQFQFILYLYEEILQFKNPDYVSVRDSADFRKGSNKKMTKREYEKELAVEKKRLKEQMERAILDYSFTAEGVAEIETLEKQLKELTYISAEEFNEIHLDDSGDWVDDLWNENFENGKKRYPILDKLSKLRDLDLYDSDFPKGSYDI